MLCVCAVLFIRNPLVYSLLKNHVPQLVFSFQNTDISKRREKTINIRTENISNFFS